MLIQFAGCSGSGKTTLAKRVQGELYTRHEKLYKKGRNLPSAVNYFDDMGVHQRVRFVGHYDSPSGGCDTYNYAEEIVEQVRLAYADNFHVIYEGLLVNSGMKKYVKQHRDDGYNIQVVHLNTSLDLCLESINHRRMVKWHKRWDDVVAENERLEKLGLPMKPVTPPKPPIDPKITTQAHRYVTNTVEWMKAAGYPIKSFDRNGAFEYVASLLRQPIDDGSLPTPSPLEIDAKSAPRKEKEMRNSLDKFFD